MGYIKNTFRAINAIVSLGGSEALITSKMAYQESYREYTQLLKSLESIMDRSSEILNSIGDHLGLLVQHTQRVNSILKKKHDPKFNLTFKVNSETLSRISRLETSYNTTLNVGFGGLAGGSAAAGAWALVTTFGSASTGTAISSLSGIASYNATMAWFGGGSLAVGGGGMAAGLTTLRVIAIAPAVLFSTYSTYKQADKIDAEHIKLLSEIERIKPLTDEATEKLLMLKVAHRNVIRPIDQYLEESSEIINMLYPSKWVSFKRFLCSISGKPTFTKAELLLVARLDTMTLNFLSRFEKTVATQKMLTN